MENLGLNKLIAVIKRVGSKLLQKIGSFMPWNRYEFIMLLQMGDSGKSILQKAGIRLDNIESISEDNISREEICLHKFKEFSGIRLSDSGLPPHQQSVIETGYMFSTCPVCGGGVRTNQSFCVFTNMYDQQIFYRFICCDEFYLITGQSPQIKIGVYLPKQKIIISFIDYQTYPHYYAYYGKKYFSDLVNTFKSYMRKCRDEVEFYILDKGKKSTTVIAGFCSNLAHHTTDELSAFEHLSKTGSIGKVSGVLTGPYDFLKINIIFPEAVTEKLNDVENDTAFSLFSTVLKKNYFAVRLSCIKPIQDSFAKRAYEFSSKQCTELFMQQLEISRRCFPLVWVTLRSHVRIWLSETEGLANLINKMHSVYPNMGIVFDGFHQERAKMEKIMALLPRDVKVFDALRCSVFETIVWTHAVDFFIGPFGNSTIFTSLANKTGIVHTHKEWSHLQKKWSKNGPFCPNKRENGVLVIMVSGDYEEKSKDVYSRNYEVAWEDIYAEAMKLAEEVKRDS